VATESSSLPPTVTLALPLLLRELGPAALLAVDQCHVLHPLLLSNVDFTM
jgi:hypothetical protein